MFEHMCICFFVQADVSDTYGPDPLQQSDIEAGHGWKFMEIP